MNLDAFVQHYGMTLTAVGYFAWRELWPFLRDKLWPAAAAAATQQQQREDRLIAAIEQNARASAALETTLESINGQLSRQAEVTQLLSEDMAGLYGHIGMPRPSRRRADASASPRPTAGNPAGGAAPSQETR